MLLELNIVELKPPMKYAIVEKNSSVIMILCVVVLLPHCS